MKQESKLEYYVYNIKNISISSTETNSKSKSIL